MSIDLDRHINPLPFQKENSPMTEATGKVPVKAEERSPARATAPQGLRPFESLRREVDRLFHDFDQGFLRSPFRRSWFDLEPLWGRASRGEAEPAVDIIEKDNAYEITADLPGMDEKNIEVKLSNDGLTIRGEKQEEREEQKRDYYLHERSFGAFERSFTLPEGVDADKIEASFKKGVLTVTLPKRPEAIKPEKQIPVKPGT
jgi:HSP20 family protein